MTICKQTTTIGFIVLFGFLGTSGMYMAMDHAAHDKDKQAKEEPANEHSEHMAMMDNNDYKVTTENYKLPDAKLIDQSGKTVRLNSIIYDERPIALNFIFTTCTTICPVMTSTFAQMQKHLGDAGKGVRIVSITIDPEYDRPEILKKYAELFNADSNWDFLTGDSKTVSEVIRAFNAYFGSKMNHKPLTLLKHPSSAEWIRIEGLASGADLAKEVKARLLD